MSTSCHKCPLRALETFESMRPDEVDFMARFKAGELNIAAGTPILVEGSRSPQLFTVLRGMGLRYKTLEDGRRQVINFVLPGDFIGLQSGVGADMGHSVEATTPMTLCVFKRADLWSLFTSHPSRAFDLTWLAATEEHFLGESLVTVGQRSAVERIAWAIVCLHERFDGLNMLVNGSFDFPYRQQDLADTLGLSLVHTNKTLARLRERDLVSWTNGVVRVRNLAALRKIAILHETGLQKSRPLI